MSYCTDCIHYKVCGNEGVDDSAMTYCVDKQKEKITAEWVGEFIGGYKQCSYCRIMKKDWTPFCPECGAKMEVRNKE